MPGGYSVSNWGLGGLAHKNMIGKRNNGGGDADRSAGHDLSIINNKSEMISDISQNDLSAYVSREKRKMNNEPTNPSSGNQGFFSGLFTKTEDNV